MNRRTMKVYSNYSKPTFSQGLAKLLVESLEFTGEDIWLISPTLKDVRLAIAQLGDFASLLGGQREEIEFSELLTCIAERNRLRVVTKPPGELVSFQELKRLADKFELQRRLREEQKDELQGYSIVNEVIEDLNADIELLANAATRHAETICIGRMLQAKGAELYYLDKLDANLLWTPIGVLIGSAKFTNEGLSYNDILMLGFTNSDEWSKLQIVAKQLVDRAVPAQNYSFNKTLEKVGLSISDYRYFLRSKNIDNYPELRQVLEQINHLII